MRLHAELYEWLACAMHAHAAETAVDKLRSGVQNQQRQRDSVRLGQNSD